MFQCMLMRYSFQQLPNSFAAEPQAARSWYVPRVRGSNAGHVGVKSSRVSLDRHCWGQERCWLRRWTAGSCERRLARHRRVQLARCYGRWRGEVNSSDESQRGFVVEPWLARAVGSRCGGGPLTGTADGTAEGREREEGI